MGGGSAGASFKGIGKGQGYGKVDGHGQRQEGKDEVEGYGQEQ